MQLISAGQESRNLSSLKKPAVSPPPDDDEGVEKAAIDIARRRMERREEIIWHKENNQECNVCVSSQMMADVRTGMWCNHYGIARLSSSRSCFSPMYEYEYVPYSYITRIWFVCEIRAKMISHISAMLLHCSILPVQTIWDNPGESPGAA